MRVDFATRSTVAVAAAAMLAVIGTTISAQTRPAVVKPPPASAAAGEALTRTVCGTACHNFEHVITVRRTRAQWQETIENMIGRGAKATNAEVAAILEFLSSSYTLSATTIRGGSGPEDKMMVDPTAAQTARPLYESDCRRCHGPDARGTSDGANLVRSDIVLKNRYGDTPGPYLRDAHPPIAVPGKPGAASRPVLTNMQVLLLSHFLRERITDTLRGSPLFKAGDVLTGNAKAGQEYFNGEGGCARCHQPTGDLAAIGRRMDPITIQQRFLFPNNVGSRRRSTPAPAVTVTVTLPSGESLTGPLVHMDDFYVSLRDASGMHRTVRRGADVRVVKNDPYAAHIALLPRITDKAMHDVVAYLASLK